MNWKKDLLVGVYMLCLLGGCGSRPSHDAEAPPPEGEARISKDQFQKAAMATKLVAEEDVGDTIVSSGRVTFDDARVTHVFSPVNGRILKVLAQLGERVDRGAPLVVMASPDIGQAFSDYVKAKADLAAAQSEFQRQKELFEAHAGAQRDLESAEDNYRKAQGELDRAHQKIVLLAPDAQDRVTQDYLLRAPIAGEVVARTVNPGVEVQGQYSGGTAVELFTIGELDRVWVLADVYEVDLPKIKKGAAVTVKVVSYPDKAFRGTVDWISGALDPTSHTSKVRCSIANPERELRAEMYATAAIGLQTHRRVAVPRSAVLRLGDQSVVFVRKGETPQGALRFERRRVEIRESLGAESIEVTSGLSSGEEVVTSGAILLVGTV
jgi:cobalt-zinc-cadmium efflux system membrane fusion protein